MPLQINPDELLGIFNAEYQPRAEPQFALAKAISTYLALPGLRGLYPMSAVGVAGQAQDLQSLGNHLTRNGDPQFSYENLIPYCQYDGTGDYHDITDAASGNAFDILGTETFIETAERGLSCGFWVKPEETGTLEYIIAKWGNAGNRAYRIGLDAANNFFFEISDNGTNSTAVFSAAITTFNVWYYVAGRFIPSTSVDIFVNGVESNQPTARASIFNSTANFTVAAREAGTGPLQGRISMAHIEVMQLSNPIIQNGYQQTRTLYNT